jgi:hypothetical protein
MAIAVIKSMQQTMFSITKTLVASFKVFLALQSVVSAQETTRSFAKKFAYSRARNYSKVTSILSFAVLKKIIKAKMALG